jgi:hypothetical protein
LHASRLEERTGSVYPTTGSVICRSVGGAAIVFAGILTGIAVGVLAQLLAAACALASDQSAILAVLGM